MTNTTYTAGLATRAIEAPGRFDYVRCHPQEIEGLLEACFVPFSNYNVELFMRVYIYIELEFRFSPVNHRAHVGIQASVSRCGGA